METKEPQYASISLLIPIWLYRPLKRLKNRIRPQATPNLAGDRDIEWSWIASQIPEGPGKALDFGPGQSNLSLIAALRGFDVTAVDLEIQPRFYVNTDIQCMEADLLDIDLPPGSFDLVINCSTVEHVGLAGRYGVTSDRPDGDLEAMALLRELMKPGGVMIITIPVGRDSVFAPLTRVYGNKRLPRLLEGYIIEKEEFWIKDINNRWISSERDEALDFQAYASSWNPMRNAYALGCFVLRR